MGLQIGKLDRLITIQTPSESTNGYGERTSSWGTYAQVWARLNEMPGPEKYENNQDTAVHRVNFTIRYNSGITEKMRISYNSKTYEIQNIREMGRNEAQEIATQYKF